MPPGKAKYRFESEVHLGLLSIVMVLLLLSVASNVVLFNARARLQDETTDRLRLAIVATTRTIQENNYVQLPDSVRRQLVRRHNLSELAIVPDYPDDSSETARIAWLRAIVKQPSYSQLPEVVDRLLRAEPNKLMRGDSPQFFLVASLPGVVHSPLIVVAMSNPELAYLEDGNRVVLWTGIGVTLLAALGYAILSRYIFRPFRRIREQAILAGREVNGMDHEADAVVEEYRQVIRDLRNNEAELTRLNAAIQKRADSLEQFNDYLLTSIDSGIITLDLQGHVKMINDAGRRILGIAELTPETHFGCLLGEDGELARAVHHGLRRQVQSGYRELLHKIDHKREVVLGVAISVVRDSTGTALGLSVLFSDLTELVDLRRQVEQNGRLAALGEMAAGLAHQIRNSLGAIGGFGNLLKRRMLKLNQTTDMAESLLKETREAEDLVSKFLAFARPLDPQTTPFSVRELVDEICAAYATRDDLTQVDLQVLGSDVMIEADPLLMKQVVGNLIDNAIQAYDNADGRVEVRIAESNGIAQIRIVDFGRGIPQDKLDKVFTPFYSSRPSGTGLGLPLATRIVDLHGGTLRVESQTGQGTTVIIQLPAYIPSLQPAH